MQISRYHNVKCVTYILNWACFVRDVLARVVQHGIHILLASHRRRFSSLQVLGPLSARVPYSPFLCWDNRAAVPDSVVISEVAWSPSRNL